jgi:protein-L-isoaspartate(D-aspartate) O-methyltransferase
MIDFAEARYLMVEGQVRTFDVTDASLLAAMLEVPRERFVPLDKQAFAYSDRDLPVLDSKPSNRTRCLLKPMVLAKLIQSAEVGEESHVLDVGCATGYSAAVLARLARDVVAVEEDAELATMARQVIAALKLTNVDVVTAALTEGLPARAPYDVIVLNGSIELPPKTLFGQLKDGGRLVGVFGRSPIGKAMVYRAEAGHVTGYPTFEAVAPLLPGFAKPPGFVF